ncbi:hypothetical protein ISU95_21745 [Enterobacter cloacae]|uniref:hypothetical protein n=1 Tax=Enterobacter cloacae complex TaxID=354276 RepID=UPI00188AD06F|nr:MULTISPECIES: hypothetical protein [Enterobacter cloacae complex]MBF4159643.1 hypothetical protein [Enterobacter cloacae]MDY3567840.1 hypothetical protein [Enterobacter hormaechei]HAS0921924.1 hypothetical protein [Enterobacter cloacae]
MKRNDREKFIAKGDAAPGQQRGLWCYQHPEEELRRARGTPEDEQGHAAMTGSRARRNGVAPYMALMPLVLIDAMPEAQETARLSGAAGTAAASGVLRHGMEARRAETAWLALCGA